MRQGIEGQTEAGELPVVVCRGHFSGNETNRESDNPCVAAGSLLQTGLPVQDHGDGRCLRAGRRYCG